MDNSELNQMPVLNFKATDTDGLRMAWSSSMLMASGDPSAADETQIRLPFAVPFKFAALKPVSVKLACDGVHDRRHSVNCARF